MKPAGMQFTVKGIMKLTAVIAVLMGTYLYIVGSAQPWRILWYRDMIDLFRGRAAWHRKVAAYRDPAERAIVSPRGLSDPERIDWHASMARFSDKEAAAYEREALFVRRAVTLSTPEQKERLWLVLRVAGVIVVLAVVFRLGVWWGRSEHRRSGLHAPGAPGGPAATGIPGAGEPF